MEHARREAALNAQKLLGMLLVLALIAIAFLAFAVLLLSKRNEWHGAAAGAVFVIVLPSSVFGTFMFLGIRQGLEFHRLSQRRQEYDEVD